MDKEFANAGADDGVVIGNDTQMWMYIDDILRGFYYNPDLYEALHLNSSDEEMIRSFVEAVLEDMDAMPPDVYRDTLGQDGYEALKDFVTCLDDATEEFMPSVGAQNVLVSVARCSAILASKDHAEEVKSFASLYQQKLEAFRSDNGGALPVLGV